MGAHPERAGARALPGHAVEHRRYPGYTGLAVAATTPPRSLGSIVAEWRGFPHDPATCHLGLGWDRAIAAFDLRLWSDDDLRAPWRPAPASGPLLGEAAPFFAAEAGAGGASFAGGRFAILIVTAGAGVLAAFRGRVFVMASGARC